MNNEEMTFQKRREHIAPYKDRIYGFDDGGITYLPRNVTEPSILVQMHPELMEQILSTCKRWVKAHGEE